MVGTGTIKCLTVLCEVGLGTSPAAPSPHAVGKVVSQPGAPRGLAQRALAPPEVFEPSSSLPVVLPHPLRMCESRHAGACAQCPAAPGRDPTGGVLCILLCPKLPQGVGPAPWHPMPLYSRGVPRRTSAPVSQVSIFRHGHISRSVGSGIT